jgi:hypothetical protein
MGLWVRNVGVRAPVLPASLAALAARKSEWVPQTRCWTWTTLRGEEEGGEEPDEEQLEEIARRAAAEASAPALAFLVDDSDVAYLVGADTRGIGFRLVIGEQEGRAPQEFEQAAEWAAEHTPVAPTAEAVREAAGRPYVFAEEGLWVVLATMGLVPGEEAGGAELMQERDVADDWTEEDERREREVLARVASPEDWGEPVGDPEVVELAGRRWYARIEFPTRERERWAVVAHEVERDFLTAAGFLPSQFDAETVRKVLPEDLQKRLAQKQTGIAAWLCTRGQIREVESVFPSLKSLRSQLAGPGSNLRMGDWREVPQDVPAKLAETAAYALSQA